LIRADYENTVLAHYSKTQVQQEIVRFSQNRWVAVHCETVNPHGYQVLLRYDKVENDGRPPLMVTKPEHIIALLSRLKNLRPRTFHASICLYKELSRHEHVRDMRNITHCAPTWNIDNTPEKWKATMRAAKMITNFLLDEGVSKSVFVKWSGKGAHVHLHHQSLSSDLREKIAPLDAAYATVEYVNRKLAETFADITEEQNAPDLRVDNEIDLQRVFTCPLSLH